MEDNTNNEKVAGTNPMLAIGIAIIIVFMMVATTTVSFLHSGAYTTVKQIQIGTKAVESINQDNLDISSPINAADIDKYAASINQRIEVIDDYADFGPEAVADSSLGL